MSQSKRPDFKPFSPFSSSLVDEARENAEAFNIKTHDYDREEFRSLPSAHPDLCFVIIRMDRPSAVLLCTDAETSLYPPSTSRNLLLNLMLVDWQRLDWSVLSFPAHDIEAFEAIAQRQEFRLLPPGTIPRAMNENGVTSFPIEARENVYTVENTKRDILAQVTPQQMAARLLKSERELRERWANSVPLIRVRAIAEDDPFLGTNCTVCHTPFAPGAAVAVVGEDDTSEPRLAIEVCAEHVKGANNADPH